MLVNAKHENINFTFDSLGNPMTPKEVFYIVNKVNPNRISSYYNNHWEVFDDIISTNYLFNREEDAYDYLDNGDTSIEF
jgi:hypothetical protein